MPGPTPRWIVNNKISNIPLRYVTPPPIGRTFLPNGTIIAAQLLAADDMGLTSPPSPSPLGTAAAGADNVSVDVMPTVVAPPLRGYAMLQITVTLPVPGPDKITNVFVLFIDDPLGASIEAETNMITTR
jgi:hypothetical protein